MNLLELSIRIRSARSRRGYTLDRLSEISGLAKGLISKVENFRVTPSLPTLAKLCEALGVPLSEILDGLDRKPKISITRVAERQIVERNPDISNVEYSSLAHGRPNRSMDPLELRIPPKGGRQQALSHEGEEFMMVLEGIVHLELEGLVHELQVGDTAYFDAELPHRVLNPTDSESRLLCVNLDRAP